MRRPCLTGSFTDRLSFWRGEKVGGWWPSSPPTAPPTPPPHPLCFAWCAVWDVRTSQTLHSVSEERLCATAAPSQRLLKRGLTLTLSSSGGGGGGRGSLTFATHGAPRQSEAGEAGGSPKPSASRVRNRPLAFLFRTLEHAKCQGLLWAGICIPACTKWTRPHRDAHWLECERAGWVDSDVGFAVVMTVGRIRGGFHPRGAVDTE